MRNILVDNARKHRSAKRGGGAGLPLDEALSLAPENSGLVIALDEALQELAKVDERRARLIELKYFTGLKGEELAEALGVSVATVTRESRLAEAWLRMYLSGE